MKGYNSTVRSLTGIKTISDGFASLSNGVLSNLNSLDADSVSANILTTPTINNLENEIHSKQDKVANVSDTEIGFLDGVTSNIQTQFNLLNAENGLDSDIVGFYENSDLEPPNFTKTIHPNILIPAQNNNIFECFIPFNNDPHHVDLRITLQLSIRRSCSFLKYEVPPGRYYELSTVLNTINLDVYHNNTLYQTYIQNPGFQIEWYAQDFVPNEWVYFTALIPISLFNAQVTENVNIKIKCPSAGITLNDGFLSPFSNHKYRNESSLVWNVVGQSDPTITFFPAYDNMSGASVTKTAYIENLTPKFLNHWAVDSVSAMENIIDTENSSVTATTGNFTNLSVTNSMRNPPVYSSPWFAVSNNNDYTVANTNIDNTDPNHPPRIQVLFRVNSGDTLTHDISGQNFNNGYDNGFAIRWNEGETPEIIYIRTGDNNVALVYRNGGYNYHTSGYYKVLVWNQ